MSSNVQRRRPKATSRKEQVESLYHKLVKYFYENDDRGQALKIAVRLEERLVDAPDYADSIRAAEIYSLIAELRGDYAEAARCREAEIRKILELHSLAVNSPSWKYVARQYDFDDVSDRLDLLAMLYDKQGDTHRAISTLIESKHYCESHDIPFDGQALLDELAQAQNGAALQIKKKRQSVS